MVRAMLWRRMITAICLVTCAINWTPTSANPCGIEYTPKTVVYERDAILSCQQPPSPYKWWRSDSPCGNFTGYSTDVCSSSSGCRVTIDDSIGRYFYYCCTASTVTDVLSAGEAQIECFKIQVCTDTSMNIQGATTAFFNEPVQIYINMTSEPPPSESLSVSLTQSFQTEVLNNTFSSNHSTGIGARLVWQYVVQVPDLNLTTDSGNLRFSVTYEHEAGSCPSEKVMYTIPVLRRKGEAPPRWPVCKTDESTTAGVVTSSTDRDTSLAVLGVVLGFILLISLIFNVVACVCGIYYCCRRRQSHYHNSYSGTDYGIGGTQRPSGRDYSGPGSTPLFSPPISQDPSPATPQAHPLRDSTHPLTLVARGELPSNGIQTTAEHTSNGPHTLHGNTPTPSAQQRTLPGLPGTSLSQAPANNVMETIHEEREKERNDVVVYERLVENVTLSERQTDSGAVKV